jgi:hypothetical protein
MYFCFSGFAALVSTGVNDTIASNVIGKWSDCRCGDEHRMNDELEWAETQPPYSGTGKVLGIQSLIPVLLIRAPIGPRTIRSEIEQPTSHRRS